MENKEILSAGICDDCKNCVEHYDEIYMLFVCKVIDVEIIPLPPKERLLECEHYEKK